MDTAQQVPNPFLEAALEYAAHGWPVFPLRPRQKQPLTKNGFKDASRDPEKIRAWWSQWPDANIGVPAGHAIGAWVLDLDCKNGSRGLDTYERLSSEKNVRDTLQQITGSGGKQLFFRLPGFDIPCFGQQSAAHVGLDGCDVKGDGGYVVVPPSIHPDTGRPYEWDGLEPFFQQPILEAPMSLLQRVAQLIERSERKHPEPVAREIPQGQRDNALTSVAGSMRRRGAEFAEIRAALMEMNEHRCKPPLPGPQVEKIARSVCRYPPAGGPAAAEVATEPARDGDARIATQELATMITADSHFAVDLGGKLYVYQDGVYQPSGEAYVRRRVKALLTELDRPKQWTSHRTDEVVKYIAVDVPRLWEWPHPEVVNVRNGLLHVVTREFTPHTPEFLSSIQLPVKYDPEAECPAWEKFVSEVFPWDAQDLAGKSSPG
ncbi:MAG: bifunctional DNA primase/polymerase [Acidobacteria bacterium]|nr:bifunctional DNA primase/polymerase [Acidobacteriota bacterium]